MRQINKYDIFYITLEKGVGSEQNGRRVCMVAQNNKGNLHSPTTIIAIISSADKGEFIPTVVNIGKDYGLIKESYIHCEQLFTIDKVRLAEYVGNIDNELTQSKIDTALKISLGVN